MRHYGKLALLFWFALPVSLSMYCGESLLVSVQVNCWRYVVSLHNTWLVNSLAHRSGSRPYNRNIQPRENTLVVSGTVEQRLLPGSSLQLINFPTDILFPGRGLSQLSPSGIGIGREYAGLLCNDCIDNAFFSNLINSRLFNFPWDPLASFPLTTVVSYFRQLCHLLSSAAPFFSLRTWMAAKLQPRNSIY